MQKLTNIDFIEKAKNLHGDKYDYSIVNYLNNITKVNIICPKHGEFLQFPNGHLIGQECPKCSSTCVKSTDQFILSAKTIHNNIYDYSLVNYVNNRMKIKIICSKHGIFEQAPYSHLNGNGCPKCAVIKNSGILKKTQQEFINESIKLHNNKYDYSKVNYINAHTKIIIICPEHGEFKQKPNNHLNGRGCPSCSQSKGEKIIENILLRKNLNFIKQKTFKNCKCKQKLQFDFYLPEHNTCIEYDGRQHFEPIKYFGGEVAFKILQERDKIKENFCNENNINLMRIKYNENIENKLKVFIRKRRLWFQQFHNKD
jgi:very-short-patch-repair endonuclease